ncbi:MAG: hypothetical protein AB1813_20945 [Verrucomicrobiota bacterium]
MATGLALGIYAQENEGRFPLHTNGYGDALLLLLPHGAFPESLTGPGFDAAIFERASHSGGDVPENQCGRVYIPGLSETNNPAIAIFFDKLASPGGDHCHFFHRFTAPMGREVWTIGGSRRFILERDWPSFMNEQLALLVEAGFTGTAAEQFYAETKTASKR